MYKLKKVGNIKKFTNKNSLMAIFVLINTPFLKAVALKVQIPWKDCVLDSVCFCF
jgi:hypothetical protein